MRLYLMQHGKALSKDEDPKRSLSSLGRKETEYIASFLRARQIRVDSIWHSSKERAEETAELIARAVGISCCEERSDLQPNDPVEAIPQELHERGENVLIVGHLPFLQKLLSLLLIGREKHDIGGITYSGIICLSYDETWNLEWIVTPQLI